MKQASVEQTVTVGTVSAPAGTHELVVVLVGLIASTKDAKALRTLRTALSDAASKCTIVGGYVAGDTFADRWP